MKDLKKSKLRGHSLSNKKRDFWQRMLTKTPFSTSINKGEQVTQRAFTLIEMIIVVLIIAVLAAAGIIALNGALNSASSDQHALNVAAVNNAIFEFYGQNNVYPGQANLIAPGSGLFQNATPSAGSDATTVVFPNDSTPITLYEQPGCVTVVTGTFDYAQSAC